MSHSHYVLLFFRQLQGVYGHFRYVLYFLQSKQNVKSHFDFRTFWIVWYKNGCLRAIGAFGPLKVFGFRAVHFALVLFASIKSKNLVHPHKIRLTRFLTFGLF